MDVCQFCKQQVVPRVAWGTGQVTWAVEAGAKGATAFCAKGIEHGSSTHVPIAPLLKCEAVTCTEEFTQIVPVGTTSILLCTKHAAYVGTGVEN